MSNFSQDQSAFMLAGGQTVGVKNIEQAARYAIHLREEAEETFGAVSGADFVKAADGAVDSIVVAIGLLHSLGIDPNAAWDAVHRANMRKVVGGNVYRRPDGQIGKPPGWFGPEEELRELCNQAGLSV